MKPSSKDQLKGAYHAAKGSVKEETGKVMKDEAMEEDGADEKFAGKVQKGVGKIEKSLGA